MREAPDSAAIRWTDSQPAASQGEQAVLLWHSVRIDNRAQLLTEIDLPPATSDEALLIALYGKFGEECADRILGDFAFAIQDTARGHIYLARDIMGCQPLYYSVNQTGLFLAGRLQKLLEFSEVARHEDEAFIAASLSYAFADFERTSFAEVRKLPPAHYAIIREGSVTLHEYWHPSRVKPRRWPDHETCLAEFRALLRQAISDRLPADGPNDEPVGVHVSGGLDCSSIAILTAQIMAEQGGPPPLALTWYPAPEPDLGAAESEEYERVDAVCAAMGVAPLYTEPSVENVIAVLRQDHRINPVCNASYNERLSLQQAQERGARVILSGFGGDEAASFDGRGYIYELALAGKWGALRPFAKQSRHGPIRYTLNQIVLGLAHRFFSDDKLQDLQYSVAGGRQSQFKKLLQVFLPGAFGGAATQSEEDTRDAHEARPYLHPDIAKTVEPLPPIPAVRYSDSHAARANLLRWPGLINRIEAWHAQAAEFGITHAYPLLDRRVVEFALSLPGSVFQDADWKRLFYRQAMDPILPPEVCWRNIKSDPARADPLIAAMKEAFAEIGKGYQEGNAQPGKARYVDMERLIKDLEPEALANRSRTGKLVAAMEFLGATSRQK